MRDRQIQQMRFAVICSRRWGVDLLTALERIYLPFRAMYPN